MYDMSTYNSERGRVPHVAQQLLEAIVRHAQMLQQRKSCTSSGRARACPADDTTRADARG